MIKNHCPTIFFRTSTLLLIALSFSLNTTLLAATGKKPEPESVVQGKVLYEKHCILCHKKDGVGEATIPRSILKPGHRTAMPLNETSHAWHHSDEQLVKTILEGIPGNNRMPPRKDQLSRKEAKNLVDYIKSLWSDKIIACQGPKHMTCM